MSRIYGQPFATVPEWVLDADVSDRAIRLFAVLGRHADKDGRAFPGRPRLAERLRCSVTSLDRAIGELTEAGALTVQPEWRKDGGRTSNSYWLWPALPPVTDEATPTHPRDHPLPTHAATPLFTGDEGKRNESQSVIESQKNEHRRAAPRSAFPDCFTLTDAMRSWASEHTPALDLERETDQFSDYWRARGERRADWVAAWRTWCRNAVKFAQPKGKARPVDDRRGGSTSEVRL